MQPSPAAATGDGRSTVRRRVLVATSTFPLGPDDPTPRFVLDLAEALAASCDVTVLAPGAPGAPPRERMGAVEVLRFGYFLPRSAQRLAYGGGMRENLRGSPLTALQVPFFLAAETRAIRSVVAGRGIGVVNSHWLVPQGLAAARARGPRRRGRFRHVLHVHAADVFLLEKLPFGRAVARYVVARTDALFAAGSGVRDALDRLLGAASGAVIQPMGARAAFFRGDGAPRPATSFAGGFLLFVGRFVEKKGVVYLLRALPRVRREHPELGLVLVGYGPLEAELRAEIERLGLGGAVELAGRRPHAEVVGYLRACRAAVVPSIVDSRGETEGMPTVVVETMAAGARVVASAVDGIPDVVRHGVNGWLCRPKDPGDLAEKILLALRDPSPSPIVREALATAEGLDWSRIAERYRRCFEELEAAPPGASAGS